MPCRVRGLRESIVEGQGSAIYRFGRFTLDPRDERLSGPTGPVKLGNKAYRVLLTLIREQGRLVTKDTLFETVWDGTIVSESALTSVIKELRRALGDDARAPEFIESAYGRGYRFRAGLDSVASTPSMPAFRAAIKPDVRNVHADSAPLLMVPPVDDRAVSMDQPHLGPILREDLLIALSRFQEIRLVSDTVAPDGAVPLLGLGPRDYRLQLTLVPDGGSTRALVRLTRMKDGEIVWADNAPMGAGGFGQDIARLVGRIAGVTLPKLYDDVLRAAPAEPHGVYDRYFAHQLKMRMQNTPEEALAVAAGWEELIADHPAFVPAYAPLIRLYNTDLCYAALGMTTNQERARAVELARDALSRAPEDSHLHSVQGWCCLWAGAAAQAAMHFEQSLRLSPYNQRRLVVLATGFLFLGERGRARKLLDAREALSPFPTEMPYEEEGLLCLLESDFQRSAELVALARRPHPDHHAMRDSTIMAELYGLLAAAGLESVDLPLRLARWRRMMAARWYGPTRPDDRQLRAWVEYHNPLQQSRDRLLFVDLLNRALACTGPAID